MGWWRNGRMDQIMVVPLTNSDKVAIIDDWWKEDVLENGQKWFLDHDGYVESTMETGFKSPKVVYLHRLIMGDKVGFVIDHINGDKLDNREANLRHLTLAQSAINKSMQNNNKSGFPGVRLTRYGTWEAYIAVDRQRKHIGTFPTFEEAVATKKKAVQELHGEYARKS
jgi:hypothetical protein